MKPFTNCDGCCGTCPATTCEDRKTENIPTHTTTWENITNEPTKELERLRMDMMNESLGDVMNQLLRYWPKDTTIELTYSHD
jgi:hypothetical protein